MLNLDKILLLSGGVSFEKEVSQKTASNCYKQLKKLNKYTIELFEVTDDICLLVNKIKTFEPCVVFNCLHGKFGEDGAIQSILNFLKVPYTHSSSASSAIAMNKVLTKKLVSSVGVEVAKDISINSDKLSNEHILKVPYVVKPVSDGSSCGVNLFLDEDKKPIDTISYEHNIQLMAEEFICGREITVGICNGKILGITEIFTNDSFYDYESKYQEGKSTHVLDPDLNKEVKQKLINYSKNVFSVLGLNGVARMDYRCDGDRVVFLEVNTQPGMTEMSLIPEQALNMGMNWEKLLDEIISTASFEE